MTWYWAWFSGLFFGIFLGVLAWYPYKHKADLLSEHCETLQYCLDMCDAWVRKHKDSEFKEKTEWLVKGLAPTFRDSKGRFCKFYWKRVIVDTKTGKYWPNPDP